MAREGAACTPPSRRGIFFLFFGEGVEKKKKFYIKGLECEIQQPLVVRKCTASNWKPSLTSHYHLVLLQLLSASAPCVSRNDFANEN